MLKLNNGSLRVGFATILQMGKEGEAPTLELSATLPPAPALDASYKRWQSIYRRQAQLCAARIRAEPGIVTNVAYTADTGAIANQLKVAFNQWLRAPAFAPIRDKLLERLSPQQPIQLILQTEDSTVQRLPWHQWTLCDRYPNLEIALSAPTYELNPASSTHHQRVRILAILGNSQGIDISADQALLNQLPNAEIHYLVEPNRPQLNESLWDIRGWDILFFAGHSETQFCEPSGQSPTADSSNTKNLEDIGKLHINPTDTLTVAELKYALGKAVARGLKIAIFNSCDGLGLAHRLSGLRLSQILVMRELIPDRVAHTFLKSFLSAFSRGEPLYLAVREAREKLQGLENTFPCASWLPIIYQNPAECSPQWQTLYYRADDAPDSHLERLESPLLVGPGSTQTAQLTEAGTTKRQKVLPALVAYTTVCLTLIGMQSLGLFQGLELKVFDFMMRSRPPESPDPRIVVVNVTEADVQAQSAEERNGSLSDQSLAAALEKLQVMEPRLIGLDIYRDFPARVNQPELAATLKNTDNLLVVCKGSNKSNRSESNDPGIAPPPEVDSARVGFSDFESDPDGTIRRQLFYMEQELSSPCKSSYSLSGLLALNYLSQEGIELQSLEDGTLQLGPAILTPIDSQDGGYETVDSGGYQLLLNYRSAARPEDVAEQVTLGELLAGKVEASAIRDRIVLIGTTDSSFRDYWQTPYSRSHDNSEKTYGVFMQAQMVSHLLSAALDGRPLIKTLPQWSEWLAIVLLATVGSLLVTKLRGHRGNAKLLLALFVTEIGLLGLCWVLFVQASYWMPLVPGAIAPAAVVVASKVKLPKNKD